MTGRERATQGLIFWQLVVCVQEMPAGLSQVQPRAAQRGEGADVVARTA